MISGSSARFPNPIRACARLRSRRRSDGSGGSLLIGVGIVGCNYGRTVLLPAFRGDRRCEVVALAGTDAARATELARVESVARGHGDWRALVEDDAVAAVAIAVPPDVQPQIACRSLALGKPVFVEKPLAGDLAGAGSMLACAHGSGKPTMIDFNFPELPAWRCAKASLDDGMVGRLRHVVVTWNVENQATRLRTKSWSTGAAGGGGVRQLRFPLLLLPRVVLRSDRRSRQPHLPVARPRVRKRRRADAGICVRSCRQPADELRLVLGSGHRIEFYGEEGTLVLANPTPDYFDGFVLKQARRSDWALQPVVVETAGPARLPDSRIAPVSRLVARFLDACEGGAAATPGFAEGYRVQLLIDAARRAHELGRWMKVAPPGGGGEERR